MDWSDRYSKKIIDWFGIKLVYSDTNNGGGLFFKDDFVNTVKKIYANKNFNNVLEWCSGPGFMGYSLLANNLCKKLSLADIHLDALEEANETAILNNISDKVTTYHSDVWTNIPKSEKFDLIISNPPWYSFQNYWNERWQFESRIYLDQNWDLHRKFFKNASDYLTDDGQILLLEGSYGSGINTFRDMINDGNLKILDHFLGDFKTESVGKFTYYIRLGKK